MKKRKVKMNKSSLFVIFNIDKKARSNYVGCFSVI